MVDIMYIYYSGNPGLVLSSERISGIFSLGLAAYPYSSVSLILVETKGHDANAAYPSF